MLISNFTDAVIDEVKVWLAVVTELKNRGVQDICIACVDGLKGFPETIETVYPQATVHLCIVHMARNSLNYVGWNKRKAVAADLKRINSSVTLAVAEMKCWTLSISGVRLIP